MRIVEISTHLSEEISAALRDRGKEPAAIGEIVSDHDTHILEETLQIMARTESYHRWIIDLIRPFFGERILEVGCGIGNVTKFLEHLPYVHSIDVSENSIETVQNLLGCRENFCIEKMDIFEPRFEALQNPGFDTIICLSVLEHIEDDREALKRFYHVMKPGGRLLLFVPALRFLYGSIDRELGHFRRYEKTEISGKITESGFTPERVRFFNFPGILGWIISGKILQRKILPSAQIALFDRLVPLIKRIEKVITPPIGTCLLCVARK